MTVVALAGCPGAPGATTTMLALQVAWPLAPGRTLIAAECDPDGGSALFGAMQGRLGDGYGLGNLTVPGRRGARDLHEALWSELLVLDEEDAPPPPQRVLLPGFTQPLSEAPAFHRVWELLAEEFVQIERHGQDVLVDLGRGGAFGPSGVLARRADVVAVVARTTLASMRAAAVRVEALQEQIRHVGLVLIEEEYRAAEAVSALRRERGVTVPLVGVLPYAPASARVFSHGQAPDRRHGRSKFMQSARTVAQELVHQVAQRRSAARPASASVGAR